MDPITMIGRIVIAAIFGLVVYVFFLRADAIIDHVGACTKAGGELVYQGDRNDPEGNVCRKEYTSCGPDENRPGYTVCEQKFERIEIK